MDCMNVSHRAAAGAHQQGMGLCAVTDELYARQQGLSLMPVAQMFATSRPVSNINRIMNLNSRLDVRLR